MLTLPSNSAFIYHMNTLKDSKNIFVRLYSYIYRRIVSSQPSEPFKNVENVRDNSRSFGLIRLISNRSNSQASHSECIVKNNRFSGPCRNKFFPPSFEIFRPAIDQPRSAGFQPAVSPTSSRQSARTSWCLLPENPR